MSGKLSLIGTPIGNLEDITLRSLRALREIDILLCEDTRVTKKLLFHYEIPEKPLWAYDEHTHRQVFARVVEALESGKHVGLVSDAGMPAISDPGSYLVAQVRAMYPDVVIDSIPGPTALTTAVALSGLDTTDGFDFVGFVPHKKGRETLFKNIQTTVEQGRVVACYESCHRVEKTLEWFSVNSPELRVTVCRELTKMFEEVLLGTASELLQQMAVDSNKLKGEFVLLFSRTTR